MRNFIAGAAVVATSQAAWAADLEVGKGRPFATIQEAIDAAAPGDRILVRPGVYRQPLAIPAGKDGLQLLGKRAVIDGHRDDGSSDYTLEVDSNEVVVDGFTIRNGYSYGVYVRADRFSIRNCRIRNADDNGLYATGEDLLAEDVDLLGGLDRAVVVSGGGTTLRRLRIRGWGEGGISIDGDDALVEDTDLRVIEDDDGIRIRGGNAVVRRCTVSGVDDEGITVEGDHAVVDACSVRAASSTGIAATGPQVTVTDCTVRGCTYTGIRATADTVVVSGNAVSRIGESNTGIVVRPDSRTPETFTATMEDNVVTDVIGWGYSIYFPASLTMRRNRAVRTGAGSGGGGFYVQAGLLQMEDCTSELAGDTGFLVIAAGDTATISLLRCVAEDAAGDGFQIGARDATVTSCEARGCGGEGLHNGAPNVTLTGCVLRGNRIDLANQVSGGGTFANDVAAVNDYDTDGPDVEPQVDFFNY